MKVEVSEIPDLRYNQKIVVEGYAVSIVSPDSNLFGPFYTLSASPTTPSNIGLGHYEDRIVKDAQGRPRRLRIYGRKGNNTSITYVSKIEDATTGETLESN